ncbi:MAG: ABC transporter permease [Ignavibacteriae bacterium]|nr:ABC transporter permease [Ignavibacteriota bacterium]
MKIPFYYVLRNFFARRLTASITITGIALVVFVFAAVLMMAHGVEKALVATGSNENAIVTRKGSNNEISSIVGRDVVNELRTMPAIATGDNGKPLYSAEVTTVINLDKKTGGMSNVSVRGVGENVFALRPQVRLAEGRMFAFGARELVVGKQTNERFRGAGLGEKIKFAGDFWDIVGVIDAGGSAFDSEIWADAEQLLQVQNRAAFSSMTFRFTNPTDLAAMKSSISVDPRLNQMDVEPERSFFEKQSEALATFLRILGLTITIIFSVGAMIGAMITMYTAVANRTVEIGTLRALGFRRRSVIAAFLVESLTLSLIGGLIGIAFASFLSFFSISTMNFGTFSELAFSFALSPSIIIKSLMFAAIMGIIGGFLPAVRASRMNIVESLRAA